MSLHFDRAEEGSGEESARASSDFFGDFIKHVKSGKIEIIMELLRDFKNISKSDVSLAGGKGASLGEMTKVGIPVPNGFVILSNAFEKFLEETDLNVEIESILDSVNHKEIHTIEHASEKIKALILQAEIPQDITTGIQKFFKNLDSKYVAVRSSATAEDSASTAWAGQLDSYLNTTEETLLENVKKCWASLFTPRAIFYRFEKDLHKQKISVAVVVQKMVESEKSGIAFSVHPITEDQNQLIIEAGFGLGEAIVSGQITPDSYVVEKNNRQILDKNINEQKKQLVRSKQGGNEWKNISEKDGKEQVLSDEEILKLAELIFEIEKHFSFPVDVEWAKNGEEFYILQSRPITTLGNKKNVRGTKLVLGSFENYQRLFQVGAMPYIISDTFSEHYRTLKCLLVYSKNTWISFLPKSTIEETLNSGVEIFGSQNLFNSYQKEFNEYKAISSEFFEKILNQEKVSKEEVSKFLEFTAGLFVYYSKTEFFYTDKAFLGSAKNPILKNSLVAMEQIKNSGREYLNKIFFGSESYLSRLLNILGKQFNVDSKILTQYNRQEILSLFDDKKVTQSITENRLKSYLMFSDEQNFTAIDGDTAESIISSFLEHSHERGVEIKGISANTGIVKGKVKIILLGYDTFDKLKYEIDAMKQGEILVAETTSPEFIVACHKAGAIITNQGGLMSHAAIVSREMNIPCIVGTGNATEILKNGDLVEVDGDSGIVKILK